MNSRYSYRVHPSRLTTPISHKQKVKSLYKRTLENIRAHYLPDYLETRYQCLKARKEFEKNINLKDMRKIKLLMEQQEVKIDYNYLYPEVKYPFSEGGINFQRGVIYPDDHLDYWSPLEKAVYPHFFAKREEMKKKFLKLYKDEHGDPVKNLGIKHENIMKNN